MVSVFRRFLLFALVPLALSACGNDSSSGSTASEHVAVTISDAGCDPTEATVPAGKIAFDVTNQGSSKVTEFYIKQNDNTIGEVENVVPGSPKTLTVTLKQGTYDMQCPNGTTAERAVLTVTQGGESGATTTCSGPGIGGYGKDSGDHGGSGSDDGSGSGSGAGSDGSGGGANTGGCGTANTSTNQTSGRPGSGDSSGSGGSSGGATPGGGGTPDVSTGR